MPLLKTWLAGPLQRGEQLGDHGFGLGGLAGEPERGGLPVQDRVAGLDDAGGLHPVCRGAQFGMLLAVAGPAAEAPFEPVPGADRRVAGCPGEYGLGAAPGAVGLGTQRNGLGGGGGLGSPHDGVERGGEHEADGQPSGAEPDGALEPRPPPAVVDGVGVADRGGLARVEREPAAVVLETQPGFLERIPVGLDLPGHRLPVAQRREPELIPGQRPGPVQGVGPLRLAGVAVDADPHQVAGHWLGAAVAENALLAGAEERAVVGKLGVVVLDDQPADVRHGAAAGAAVVAPPGRGQLAARLQRLLGLAGELLANVHPAGLGVAEVGGVEPHRGGELLLRQAAPLAPPGQHGAERLLILSGRVRAHCGNLQAGRGWPEPVSESRVSVSHRRLMATRGGVLRL